MKKKEVELGATYVAKVSGKLTRVRIERKSPHGGWEATNVDTGRPVRIKTAGRLRYPAKNGTTSSSKPAEVPHPERDYHVLAEFFPAPPGASAARKPPRASEAVEAERIAEAAEQEGEDTACDPDVCATPGCERPAALTYLGRPLCQECYEDEAADDDAPDQHGEEKQTTTTKATRPAKEPKPKRLSALDAAAQVLAQVGKPMQTRVLISTMAELGLWASPGGKTPHATLYAAMLREIRNKGEQARFRKVDRGQFEFAGKKE